MLGALILVFVLIVVIPVGVMMSGAVLSAALGWVLRAHAEDTHPGSELTDLHV